MCDYATSKCVYNFCLQVELFSHTIKWTNSRRHFANHTTRMYTSANYFQPKQTYQKIVFRSVKPELLEQTRCCKLLLSQNTSDRPISPIISVTQSLWIIETFFINGIWLACLATYLLTQLLIIPRVVLLLSDRWSNPSLTIFLFAHQRKQLGSRESDIEYENADLILNTAAHTS